MPSDTGTTRIPHGRDRAARRLFGHPEVVADLLRGFMPEGPIREFDPDSLSQGPDDRMDERLALYQSDVTWSLTLADGARMAIQTVMYCENHLRSKRRGRIPAELPVVFYTGRGEWSAARSLIELSFAERAGMLTYFAPSCYLLIDVRRMPPESLPERNLGSLMIRMERAGDSGELLAAMRLDEEWLSEEDPGLWRYFLTLAVRVLAPLEFPDLDVEQLQTLREGMEVINEGIVRELEESRLAGLATGRSEGLAEGRSEGLAEGLTTGHTRGMAEGQRSLLRHLIVGKFGDEIAERCADELSAFGGNGRMEELGELILNCRTGEEFLARL